MNDTLDGRSNKEEELRKELRNASIINLILVLQIIILLGLQVYEIHRETINQVLDFIM